MVAGKNIKLTPGSFQPEKNWYQSIANNTNWANIRHLSFLVKFESDHKRFWQMGNFPVFLELEDFKSN